MRTYPRFIRRSKRFYFEVVDYDEGIKFQSVNVYFVDGTFKHAIEENWINLIKHTYEPQPDELARFYLVKQ